MKKVLTITISIFAVIAIATGISAYVMYHNVNNRMEKIINWCNSSNISDSEADGIVADTEILLEKKGIFVKYKNREAFENFKRSHYNERMKSIIYYLENPSDSISDSDVWIAKGEKILQTGVIAQKNKDEFSDIKNSYEISDIRLELTENISKCNYKSAYKNIKKIIALQDGIIHEYTELSLSGISLTTYIVDALSEIAKNSWWYENCINVADGMQEVIAENDEYVYDTMLFYGDEDEYKTACGEITPSSMIPGEDYQFTLTLPNSTSDTSQWSCDGEDMLNNILEYDNFNSFNMSVHNIFRNVGGNYSLYAQNELEGTAPVGSAFGILAYNPATSKVNCIVYEPITVSPDMLKDYNLNRYYYYYENCEKITRYYNSPTYSR